ncbi:hypothetical protein BD779DRAFT_228318 [Infundibulicybe gibba]|nr:hypothetical protein BD779DRAFT_228318 [Infundibulicybe gibba]
MSQTRQRQGQTGRGGSHSTHFLSSTSTPGLLLVLLLLALTATNVAFTWHNISELKQLLPPAPKEYSYEGEDFPSQLPVYLPPSGLVLESGAPHFALYDDDEWGTFFPSDGFTDLGPNNRTFLLSMIHQMHCLDVIRVGFVVNGTDAAKHIQHCLRYLRQMVLCNADTTLEAADEIILNGRLEHEANGVGMVHRCKDWTVVRQYLVDHPPSSTLQQ